MNESREVESEEQNRILWLDAAKGIGIILAILGHIIPMDRSSCHYIYSFHIPLFFVLSGIIHRIKRGKYSGTKDSSQPAQQSYYRINNSREALAFLKRKCQTLLYPYAVFSFLGLIFIRFEDSLEEFGDNVPRVLLFMGIGPLWFLSALFVAEVLFFIVHSCFSCGNIGKAMAQFWKMIVVVVAFLASWWFASHFYGSVADPDELSVWALGNVVNRGIIGFLWMEIGNALMCFHRKIQLSDWCRCVLAMTAFAISVPLAAENSYVDLHYSLIGNPILYYLCGFLASYSIIIVCQFLPKYTERGLAFLGRNSLFIFATHMNLGLVPAVLQWIDLPDEWGRWLITALIVVMCEAICVLFVNRFARGLVSYSEFQHKVLGCSSFFYPVFIGACSFFLAQYAKYLWTGVGFAPFSEWMREILTEMCLVLAFILPVLLSASIKRKVSKRIGRSVDLGRLLLGVIIGNYIWYVMLYKTMKIMITINMKCLAAGAVAMIGISGVQSMWIYRKERI